ncbi:MAG: biotin/lipoyl-containing protein [Pyrinomonadaceae bacterium]
MKLQATIAETLFEVELHAQGSNVLAVVDGRKYNVDVHVSADNHYRLICDARVFDCRVEGRPESGATLEVVVGTNRHAVTLTDPKRLRGATATGAHADGAALIVAPMPGKVVRVLVQAGQKVEAGAGIAVVEAMKMQNEMKSPKRGTVVTINAEVGATVNGGDLLAVIE